MIRERKSKKSSTGKIYQVIIKYKDNFGNKQVYYKSPFFTKQEAEEFEILKKAELVKYGCIAVDNTKTFNDCFKEYMELKGDKYAPSTINYYNMCFDTYITKRIGNKLISEFKYKDVQWFLNKSGFSKPTAQNIKKVLDVTFKYALVNEYIESNPMEYVTLDMKYESEHPERNLNISDENLEIFIKELETPTKFASDPDNVEFVNKAYGIAVRIGRYMGLRISEALAIEKKDIDFDKNTINICGRLEYIDRKKEEIYKSPTLKTASSKALLPIPPKLKKVLEEWCDYNPYEKVITNIYGEWISPNTLENKLRKVSKKTGIKFRFHMGRHSLLTDLDNHGVSASVVKMLSRHKNISTSKNIYTHKDIQDGLDVVNSIYKNEGENDG